MAKYEKEGFNSYWYSRAGVNSRDYGPAATRSNGNPWGDEAFCSWKKGKAHKEDGPCEVNSSYSNFWILHEKYEGNAPYYHKDVYKLMRHRLW
jgi:hypothetical protein